MCLIALIQQSDDKTQPDMTDEEIRWAWEANSHGAGYMFSDGERLVVKKPFFKLKDLIKSFRADQKKFREKSAFILHFRLATHGQRNKAHTHPVRIPGTQCAIAHNGILWTDVAGQHDTTFFAETVLAHRSKSQLFSEKFAKYVEGIISPYNKVAMMDPTGDWIILNAEQGQWEFGVWYSNDAWQYRWNTHNYPRSAGARYVQGSSHSKVTEEWWNRHDGDDAEEFVGMSPYDDDWALNATSAAKHGMRYVEEYNTETGEVEVELLDKDGNVVSAWSEARAHVDAKPTLKELGFEEAQKDWVKASEDEEEAKKWERLAAQLKKGR